jgi:hypothetical protein
MRNVTHTGTFYLLPLVYLTSLNLTLTMAISHLSAMSFVACSRLEHTTSTLTSRRPSVRAMFRATLSALVLLSVLIVRVNAVPAVSVYVAVYVSDGFIYCIRKLDY